MARFDKECTICDVCGGRLTLPPGVIYRGLKMHRGEAERRRRQDLGTEKIAPFMDSIGKQIEEALDI